MHIAIRLDDITPDMNWENFYKMKEILDRENLKPLLGVVPDNQDSMLRCGEKNESFFEIIKKLQAEGFVVSQHGYRHLYETKDKGILKMNPFSEFAGTPYETQLEKIRKGKEELVRHGIETDIFMAPGHTFDHNTLKALKMCGFSYVTDGYYHKNYSYKGLVFLPCRNFTGKKGKGVDTICLHTNLMNAGDFREIEERIHKNRELFIDFSELMKETVVAKNFKITLQEKISIDVFRIKRYIGQNSQAEKYFKASAHKNRFIRMIKRILYLPYLLVLLLKKEHKE
ncbi:MAG: DUF2334 domain-containing protein [Lachnospiraceae bacterium]|nr:DUF2334 domain-containing protein [Lachnospiraceae bacterium]